MQNSKLVTSIVIVVLVIIGIAGYAMYGASRPDTSANTTTTTDQTSTPTQQTPPPTTVTTTPPPDTTKRTSKYKDGTYTAVGSYNSPGGPDRIGITLTLQNDIVTSVSATQMAGEGTSRRYQQMFLSGYQALVVGQNIDTLNLGAVSGSSLTPIGFNNAVAQIKTQAKA
jgi:uncharacterized protein with FMN-binding domain